MSKEVKTSLPDEVADKLKILAANKGLSVSSMVAKWIADCMEDIKFEESDTDEDVNDELVDNDSETHIRLSGKDAQKLHLKAKALNLTPTAYVRHLVYTKNFKTIAFPSDDIEQLCSDFNVHCKSIAIFVGMIQNDGKGEIFKQEVERILEMQENIRTLFGEHLKFLYSSRMKLYKEMKKKLTDEINKEDDE